MGGQSQTTDSRALLHPLVQDALGTLLGAGRDIANQVPGLPFQDLFGQQIAQAPDFLENVLSRFTGSQQALLNQGQGSSALRNLGLSTARGDFLDPNTNQALQNTLSSISDRGTRNFTDFLLPQLRGETSDPFANVRSSITEGQIAQGVQNDISNTQADVLLNNLTNERNFQNQAGNLFNAANQIDAGTFANFLGGSEGLRQIDQLRIDENLAKFNELIQAPARPFDFLAQVLPGALGGTTGSTTTTTTDSGGADAAKGVLGGLSGLAALISIL